MFKENDFERIEKVMQKQNEIWRQMLDQQRIAYSKRLELEKCENTDVVSDINNHISPTMQVNSND